MLRDTVTAHFRKEYGLPDDEILELLEEAKKTVATNIAEVTSALTNGLDPEDAAKCVHALKGNLRNMGLAAEGNLAQKLENMVRKGGNAQQTFRELKERLANF